MISGPGTLIFQAGEVILIKCLNESHYVPARYLEQTGDAFHIPPFIKQAHHRPTRFISICKIVEVG